MQIIKYCLPIAFVLSLAAAAPVDRFLVEKRETFESEALARWFNDDTDTLARALTSRGLVEPDVQKLERRLGTAAGKIASGPWAKGRFLDTLGKNLDKVWEAGKLWGKYQAGTQPKKEALLSRDFEEFEELDKRLGTAAGRIAANPYAKGRFLDVLGKNLDKVSDIGKLWGQYQAGTKKEALIGARSFDLEEFEELDKRLGTAAGRIAANPYAKGRFLDVLGKNLDKVSDIGKLWGQYQAGTKKEALIDARNFLDELMLADSAL